MKCFDSPCTSVIPFYTAAGSNGCSVKYSRLNRVKPVLHYMGIDIVPPLWPIFNQLKYCFVFVFFSLFFIFSFLNNVSVQISPYFYLIFLEVDLSTSILGTKGNDTCVNCSITLRQQKLCSIQLDSFEIHIVRLICNVHICKLHLNYPIFYGAPYIHIHSFAIIFSAFHSENFFAVTSFESTNIYHPADIYILK